MMPPTTRGKPRSGNAWAAITALAILTIAALEAFALSQGIDGTILSAALGGIAALGGAGLGRILK